MKFEWNVSNSAIVERASSLAMIIVHDLAQWLSGDGDSPGGMLLVGRMGRGYASQRPLAGRGALYAEGNDNEANRIGDGGVAGGRGGLCGSGCGPGVGCECGDDHREGAIDA